MKRAKENRKNRNSLGSKIYGVCRDCGQRSLLERIEFKRRTTPKCGGCGGVLDAQGNVGVRKRRTF